MRTSKRSEPKSQGRDWSREERKARRSLGQPNESDAELAKKRAAQAQRFRDHLDKERPIDAAQLAGVTVTVLPARKARGKRIRRIT